ncbi:hypothetical protein G7K_3679-t1 [Saitoella complicata NRRL Y-17804]|uniref:Uncharacterized protein n=1 Tax=Saitoella complicata (strain BCRC 22490 / CBS 7301 / JCM 7358 / NBRC 10748 / NRRL Y-17804) TaxID=698492 RepID=A0A0E9NJF2_SAICN|nr:hypothetical protein G7K_3679-t1 [Saitoella complicata NRRL Y-17804]
MSFVFLWCFQISSVGMCVNSICSTCSTWYNGVGDQRPRKNAMELILYRRQIKQRLSSMLISGGEHTQGFRILASPGTFVQFQANVPVSRSSMGQIITHQTPPLILQFEPGLRSGNKRQGPRFILPSSCFSKPPNGLSLRPIPQPIPRPINMGVGTFMVIMKCIKCMKRGLRSTLPVPVSQPSMPIFTDIHDDNLEDYPTPEISVDLP